jgi:hypothetical protein
VYIDFILPIRKQSELGAGPDEKARNKGPSQTLKVFSHAGEGGAGLITASVTRYRIVIQHTKTNGYITDMYSDQHGHWTVHVIRTAREHDRRVPPDMSYLGNSKQLAFT